MLPTNLEVKYKTGIADHGDSGGPLICGGSVVGTVSCHADGAWPQHLSEYYARLDKAGSWVNQVVAAW